MVTRALIDSAGMDERSKAAAKELVFEGLSRTVRAALLVRRLTRRPDPVKVVQYRQHVRDALRARLPKPTPGHSPEVIVIQLAKASNYPELKSKLFDFTPPNWMKLEVIRIADDALEVIVQIVAVRIKDGKARPVDRASDEEGRTVLIIGRIPYEKVANIDWVPDPAYGAPRLYCYFRWRWPYEAIEVHEITAPGQYFPLHGVTYRDTRFSRIESLRLNWGCGRTNSAIPATSTIRRPDAAFVQRSGVPRQKVGR
jgi:hypothetical protein